MIFHRYQHNFRITTFKRRLIQLNNEFLVTLFWVLATHANVTGITGSTLIALHWYSQFKSSGFKYIPRLSCLSFEEFIDGETGCLDGEALEELKASALFKSSDCVWTNSAQRKYIVFSSVFPSPSRSPWIFFLSALRQSMVVQHFAYKLCVFKDRIQSTARQNSNETACDENFKQFRLRVTWPIAFRGQSEHKAAFYSAKNSFSRFLVYDALDESKIRWVTVA